jgi:hypothetical protein
MVVAFGCAGISYQYDYDPDANFTGLKTFNWMTVNVQEDIHVLNVKRLKRAVNAELATKGCKMTTDNPDFLISMHATKENQTDITAWNMPYGGANLRGGSYMATSQLDVYQYEEGTLILDFVDAQSKEVLWRGIAQGEIRNYSNPVKRSDRIDGAIQKVLSNFPPPK